MLPVLLAASPVDRPNPHLASAKVFHQGLKFEKCLERLEQAGKWKNTSAQLAEIELYLGLCHLGLGHEQDAKEHFELSLKLDAQVALPPFQSPKVTKAFEAARAAVAPPPAPPVVEAPPVVPEVSDAPKRVEIDPGSSQPREPDGGLQATAEPEKHYAAPLALAGGAVVATTVAIIFGVRAKSLEAEANSAKFESDAIAIGNDARTAQLVTNITFPVAGVLGAAAVLTYFLIN